MPAKLYQPATTTAKDIPRFIPWAVLCLLCFLIALTNFARQQRLQAAENALSDVLTMRAGSEMALFFSDHKDGSILVSGEGQVLHTVGAGQESFFRGALRSLVRERKRQSISDAQPFWLGLDTGGRLVLFDPQTKRQVEIESFGPSNLMAFKKIYLQGQKS